jgi:hypothetical protein
MDHREPHKTTVRGSGEHPIRAPKRKTLHAR